MKAGRIILSVIIAASCIFSSVACSRGEKSSVGNVEAINIVDGDKIAEINIEGYGTIKAKLFPDLCPNGVSNFIMLAEQGYYDGLKIHRVLSDTVIQGGSLLGNGMGEKALINDDGEFDVETDPRARHFYGALCYANTNGKNATQFYIVNNKEPQDITKYDPEKIKVAAAAYAELKGQADENSPAYDKNAYLEQYYTRLAEMLSEKDTDAASIYMEKGGIPMFDGGYTVFGQVYEGFDVLDAISAAEVQNNAYGEKSRPVKDIIISSVTVIEYKTPTTAEASDEDNSKDKDNSDGTDETGDNSNSAKTAESDDTAEAAETAKTSEAITGGTFG